MAGRSAALMGRCFMRQHGGRVSCNNGITLWSLSRSSLATPHRLPLITRPSRHNYSTEGTSPPKPPKKPRTRLLAISLFLAGSILYLTTASSTTSSSSSANGTTLNDRTFTPYTITSRTAMSPSSFVLTVTPQTLNPDPPYLLPSSNRWRHPLWSVEFKQPEVQISRHYTPLPPASAVRSLVTMAKGVVGGGGGGEGEVKEEVNERAGQLRFYIRAVGDGEMSRYLSRLRQGHTVWLRGPHVGFDLVQRLGASKSIVFLAGGTGVVPGMQAARVVLDGFEDSKVSLLWAVRKSEEIQSTRARIEARNSVSDQNWWGFKTAGPMELDVKLAEPSPIAAQLANMKTQYGDRLSVQVVVDEENTSFDQTHIKNSLSLLTDGTPSAPTTSSDALGPCFLHNQKKHEQASEFENRSPLCYCPPTEGALPGKNLFVVSGPEGFVNHYAGSKVWSGGKQTQGPVGGVLAAILSANPRLAQDWLVLKL